MRNNNEISHLRNWTEDFNHENGNYFNCCIYCHKEFMGHKRRQMCKVCANHTIDKVHTKEELQEAFEAGDKYRQLVQTDEPDFMPPIAFQEWHEKRFSNNG